MFKPDIEILRSVKWNGEDHVDFAFEGGMCWSGAKRKDFWNPDHDWEKTIKKGCRIRLWTVQASIVLGFELLTNGKWESVWCHANNFQTKAERKKGDDAYVNFIETEGVKIAKLIDEGKTLKEIDQLIDDGHSGNTHAWALKLGIQKAKNKKHADEIREEFNEEWGVKKSMTPKSDGLVNPAVMTLVPR